MTDANVPPEVAEYPAGSPNRFDDWDKMLADFDRTIRQVKAALSDAAAHPKDALPGVLGHALHQVEAIEHEFRHVVRYAKDAESGNAELRRRGGDMTDERVSPEVKRPGINALSDERARLFRFDRAAALTEEGE